MQRDPRAYLWDMREAADAIKEFLSGVNPEAYAASSLIQSAVERKFQVIGEALTQLSKVNPALAERVPSKPQIIGFRNILVHGYAEVNHVRVWAAAQESLPHLRQAVDALLQELGSAES